MQRLDRDFFSTSAPRLARALLGKVLVRVIDGRRLAGMIVETEAYCGPKDLGSHARGGRRSARNEAMYSQAGTAYVYFTYGMHYCMNVVCGEVDEPVAVLLRALEPVEGVDAMSERRGPGPGGLARPLTDLCSGPGKLCQALGIDRRLDHTDLVTSPVLFLEERPRPVRLGVRRTARIGLGSAGAWTHKPLRWVVAANPHVSKGRPPRV